MNAEASEKSRNTSEYRSSSSEAQKQLPIQRKEQALIQSAAGTFPYSATPEQRLLRNKVAPQQDRVIVRRQHPAANLAVLQVDNDAVSIDDVDAGVVHKVA